MNIFEYAAREEQIFEKMASESGYTRKTTFYADLSIAEGVSGTKGIKDTYRNVCKSWKNDYVYFSEFVLCLNWKSWEWSSRGNEELTELYADLYYKAQDLFYETYKSDSKAREYFFNVTD